MHGFCRLAKINSDPIRHNLASNISITFQASNVSVGADTSYSAISRQCRQWVLGYQWDKNADGWSIITRTINCGVEHNSQKAQ